MQTLLLLLLLNAMYLARGSGSSRVETALNDKLQVFTCKTQQDVAP